jgi:choline kinase
MKAIILAAGQGIRLKPLTNDKPKCLLEVGGKTILQSQIESLRNIGIKDIIVVTGYKADLIKNPDIQIVHNKFYLTTNNLYSWKLALQYVDEPYLLLNGDTVFHPKVIEIIKNANCLNGLGVCRKQCVPEDMKVKVCDDRVFDINKRMIHSYGEFMGLAKLNLYGKEFIEFLDKMGRNDWFEHAIEALIDDVYFDCIDITNYPSIEIDFKEDLEKANEMFPWGQPEWEIGIRHGSDVKQEKAKDLLFDFFDILEEEKITYWCNWGLLLGIIRDKRFIPWDTDMDVSCFWEDREKVIEKAHPKMLEKGCFIPDPKVCYPEDYWFIRDMEKIELNFFVSNEHKYIYSPDRCKLWFPKRFFDKLETATFFGREVPVPSNPKEVLHYLYGDNWTVPIRDGKQIIRRSY